MANICYNTFYAYSEDQNNLKVIEDFFEDWRNADVKRDAYIMLYGYVIRMGGEKRK